MAELPSDEVDAAYAAELLALVGVTNERTFERGASLDSVRGYWVPLNEESQLSAPSAREIGEGVRSAFVTLRGRS
jgi:hypothetical protein